MENLKPDYLTQLLKIEKEQQVVEWVSIIADATPRMGGVFALVVRFVYTKDHKVAVEQQLTNVDSTQGSLNAATQCGIVQKGLQSVCLTHQYVVLASMDGFSTNELFVKMIHKDLYVEWMLNHCFSRCGNNAGEEAGFPTLD